jgi:hypothetical protein
MIIVFELHSMTPFTGCTGLRLTRPSCLRCTLRGAWKRTFRLLLSDSSPNKLKYPSYLSRVGHQEAGGARRVPRTLSAAPDVHWPLCLCEGCARAETQCPMCRGLVTKISFLIAMRFCCTPGCRFRNFHDGPHAHQMPEEIRCD